MKIINKNTSFIGFVDVCGESVFINTNTGTGFTQTFKLMKNYINKLSNKYQSVDDSKQNVYLYILEGILRYDPLKSKSLSTFLYKYVSNKMIDILRRREFCEYIDVDDIPVYNDPATAIELEKRTECWDYRWKIIIFKLFVNGENINDVAKSEKMTPWGMTRALRKKFNEARKK